MIPESSQEEFLLFRVNNNLQLCWFLSEPHAGFMGNLVPETFIIHVCFRFSFIIIRGDHICSSRAAACFPSDTPESCKCVVSRAESCT